MANVGKTYPFGSIKQIVFDGDSLTVGTRATATNKSYPAQMATNIGAAGRNGFNYLIPADSGDTMTDILFRAATSNGYVDAAFASSIYILWAGTNDLATPRTPADVATDINTRVASALGAGYDVVYVLTILPRSESGLDANFETNRQSLNTLIRNNAATNSYTVIDVGGNATIGDAGDELNTTYYHTDKIHLIDAGYSFVAGLVATVMGL